MVTPLEMNTKGHAAGFVSGNSGMTRRRLLEALLAGGVFAGGMPVVSAHGATSPRVAAIDWAMLETALAIGANVVAGSELVQFRETVVEPPVPASVSDLGLRGAPNYELLRLIAPDLILISTFYAYHGAHFDRIAPSFSATVYEPGRASFQPAIDLTHALGTRLGLPEAAQRLVQQTEDDLVHWRQALSGLRDRPVYIINVGDARHFRAFGYDSLFGDVLSRLGLTNAWEGVSSYSAAAPVSMQVLARKPDAVLAIVSPIPPDARHTLAESVLWQALPMVRQGRVLMLEPLNHFGALPTARRFLRLFGQAMLGNAGATSGQQGARNG